MRRLILLPVFALVAAACTTGSGTAAQSSSSPAPSSASSTAAPAAPAASAAQSSAAQSSAVQSSASTAASTAPAASPAGKSGTPRLEPVGSFDSPLLVTAPKGDSRLYVVERVGVVRLVEDGKTRTEPFLDVSDDVQAGGEQGLLSIAFSPTYATDGHVYVDYTNKDGDTRVVEYTRGAGDKVDPATRRVLLEVDQPFANHNGGLLIFDPTGMLIVGLGDGGAGGDPGDRGQNLGELLGKLLRIDPRPADGKPYGIPADNPFVGTDGAKPEIWAYGLRNPWRFSFDAAGSFYLADVGQGAFEEVNVVPPQEQRGANYGWSKFEGDRRFKEGDVTPGGPLMKPALTYEHGDSRCSITGGGVYAGPVTELRGRYLYGDYCSGEVWAATVDGTALKDPKKVFEVSSLASFGVDDAGEMYVVSIDGGTVQRITA